MPEAVERERSGHLPGGRVDDAQRAVGDGEDPPPVGLDDVRLVDADFLHVGAGELRDRPPTCAPPATGADTGAGTLPAVSFDVCWRGGGAICGVTTASIIGGAARPSTPTPPWVRSAPERA